MITGASSGLGAAILSHLQATLPETSTLIASSSSPAKGPLFTSRPGHPILFRPASFDSSVETLTAAFEGVDKLLFVSSPSFDTDLRNAQHQRVIDAAKAAGVGHVYYTSLAFGGLGDESKVAFQLAHVETEKMLEESGIKYTSLRMGVYADAFPLFLDWVPESETVVLPKGAEQGKWVFVLRDELGEATANIMREGKLDGKKKVLLTGTEVVTLAEVVGVINEVRGTEIKVETVESAEYVKAATKRDGSDTRAEYFKGRLGWFEGVAKGDAAHLSPILEAALGRKPIGGKEAVRGLLKSVEGGAYRWHQNEMVREPLAESK